MSSDDCRVSIDALASLCNAQERPFLSDLSMSQAIVDAIKLINAETTMPQSAMDTLGVVAAELLRRGLNEV